MITKKDFKIDYSITDNYVFVKDLSNSSIIKYEVIYLQDSKKYILIIGNIKHIYSQVFISIKLKDNKLNTHFPKLKTFGKVDSSFFKRFPLKIKNNLYFYIIDKIPGYFFKDAIINQLIDIYQFKQLLKDFLINFSKLNKKLGYLNYNLNGSTLIFENKSNKITRLKFNSYKYSLIKGLNNVYDNNLRKFIYQCPFLLTQINKLDYLNNSILKINYNNNGNYDIVYILKLINITEIILNEIPKPITLNNNEINFFNSKLSLGDKIDYLLKFPYFKSYN